MTAEHPLVDRIAEVLNAHRWKAMGVRSVECECGEILSQDADAPALTAFPADEVFRRHIASEVARAIGPAEGEDATRLGRIRRSAETAMAGTDPEYRADREEVFFVADVLWLLDQLEQKE